MSFLPYKKYSLQVRSCWKAAAVCSLAACVCGVLTASLGVQEERGVSWKQELHLHTLFPSEHSPP